ncbi:MAG: AAA family ATPase, partial [Desulfobacterales bacterium]|nr:AAA family ATPase [Desulfobacterales bacterium]
ANLQDESKARIEARPQDFFRLTYPTADVVKVLDQINARFSSSKGSSGLFLFEGLKGSGKSHLLLMIYHLFKNYQIAQDWLCENGLTCKIPDDVIVIINKFTDDPHDSIWDMIFKTLGSEIKKGKTQPKLSEFKQALGDKKVVLIFDELEQGIKVIDDPALQAQNIAFLQMISEFSNRSKQVTLFASVYSSQQEPGSTLKRVPRCVVQFDNTKDQSHIILHRLFENYKQFNKSSILPVIESYVQLWNKHAPLDPEEIKARFNDTYPFSPSLMEIILKKIPARGGFQNVRGALAFLGNLIRLTHTANDIITPGDVSLEDKATTIMLKDLDLSGDLINRAKENMEDLIAKVPMARKMAPAVLLYTLTGVGADTGVSRDNLIRDILSPATDINDIEQTLMAFQRFASYFHHQEGRYYFDLEENSEAKVEFKSLPYSDDQAREELYEILKADIFRETVNTAIWGSIEQTQELLKQFDKARPRYILTGRRLTQEERHQIYFGMDVRNTIFLLEPKDDRFQLANDKDLLKWAKRCLAGRDLAKSTKNITRQNDYHRIAGADKKYIIERIKKAGLVFVKWEKYGSAVSEDQVEIEPLAGDLSKEKVMENLNQVYFPMLRFKEHLAGRLDQVKERLVKEIDAEYRATLSFPVPVMVSAISSAIRNLCREGIIGIQHSAGNFCHENPSLTETELFNAKITAPFEKPPGPGPKICPECGKFPCQCKKPPQKCPVCKEYPCQCQTPPVVCPSCGKDPCECPAKKILAIRIPFQNSTGSLRQEAASKLQDYEDGVITKVAFKIFFQKNNVGDLSTLPSGIRGSLSGEGDITAEISISKTGRFSKSQIEQQVESLPVISGADYSADMDVEVS